MKTDELITMLANGADAVERDVLLRRYATALVCGACGAALLMLMTLGVRPDIAAAVLQPAFWLKFAFPVTLAAGALLAALRLSRPGMKLGRAGAIVAAPAVAVWLTAAVALLAAVPEQRAQSLLGASWATCSLSVAMLSVPLWLALFWAMRGLAPTRLALAGAAAGLLAGAVSAAIYSLHCTEMTAPFLGVWYVLGMLIPAAAGALLGPRLLRW